MPGEHEHQGESHEEQQQGQQQPEAQPQQKEQEQQPAEQTDALPEADEKGAIRPNNSLQIDRNQMPQLVKGDGKAFIDWLAEQGHETSAGRIPAGKLKPTQNIIYSKNMQKFMDVPIEDLQKIPVLASNDGYILDGHHRWAALAKRDPNAKIPVKQVNMPIRDLLKAAHLFKATQYQEGERPDLQTNMYVPPDEASKEYAKALIKDEQRVPKEIPHLPEDQASYFNLDDPGTVMVPMDKLTNIRARPDGIENAGKFMWAARKGMLPKRKPIYVVKQKDGSYIVADGNSTYANAVKHGWKNIAAIEVSEEHIKLHEHAPKQKDVPIKTFAPEEAQALPEKARNEVQASSYAELKQHADQAQQHFAQIWNLGKGLASQLGYETMKPGTSTAEITERLKKPGGVLLMAPVKGEKRALEKVNSDYRGDWGQLTDMVRGSIAVDSPEELERVIERMKSDPNVKIAKQPKDRMNKPLPVGYRDIMVHIRMPNGMVAEMQLHLKPMLLAKDFGEGHHHYETMRSIDAKYTNLGHKWMTQEDSDNWRVAFEKSARLYADAWHQSTAKAAPAQQQAA